MTALALLVGTAAVGANGEVFGVSSDCVDAFLAGFGFFLTSNVETTKRLAFGGAVVVGIFAAATFLFAMQQNNYSQNNVGAIVYEPSVTVKSMPDDTGTEIFVLHEGTKVIVIDEVNGWYKIKLSDGNVGWLKTSTIEKI